MLADIHNLNVHICTRFDKFKCQTKLEYRYFWSLLDFKSNLNNRLLDLFSLFIRPNLLKWAELRIPDLYIILQRGTYKPVIVWFWSFWFKLFYRVCWAFYLKNKKEVYEKTMKRELLPFSTLALFNKNMPLFIGKVSSKISFRHVLFNSGILLVVSLSS